MSTRAALVSIHALSAELLASVVCCSSLANREFMSVAGLGATPAFWAQTTDTNVKSSRTVASPAINRHFNLAPPSEDLRMNPNPTPPHSNVHGSLHGNRNYLSLLSGFVIESA